MMTTLKGLWRKQSGDDVAEYALLVAMIALAVLVALFSFGTSNGKLISDAAGSISSSASRAGGSSSGSGGGQPGGSGQGGSGQPGGGGQGGGGQGGGSGGGSGGSGGSGGGFPTNPTPIK
jgi:Flp pilus assembly pilin Flp